MRHPANLPNPTAYNQLVPLVRRILADLTSWHLPTDGSAHGPALDRHLLLNLNIALALFVAANIFLLAGLLFRRRAPRPPR